MARNHQSELGFSLLSGLVGLASVSVIIIIGWLIGHQHSTSLPVVSPATAVRQTIINPTAFLNITIWGVKLPTGVSSLKGAEYQSPVKLADGTESLKLGDSSLDSLYCVSGSNSKSSANYPSTLYRSTDPALLGQHSLYDSSSFVHIANYYYAVQHSPSPGDCSKLTATQRQAIVNVAAAYQYLWPKLVSQ